MKKSDIIKLVKDTISEVGSNAYGSATLTSQGQAKSRFTKTGRPPVIMEDEPFKKQYMTKISPEDFKNKIPVGKKVLYMGSRYEVVENNGYILKLKDLKDGDIKTVNLNMFSHGGQINEKNMEDLKNPKKADLNKDGKLSSYEKTRGAAIEKNMKEDIGDDISKAEDEVAKAMQTKADAESKLADANKKKADAEKSALEETPELTNDIGKDDYMDDEGRFAKSQVHKMAHYANKLTHMLNDMEQLPSWVQSKLTKASDYMSMVYHYLEYEFSRKGEDLMEHLNEHKKAAKRSVLMEGAMKRLFMSFDEGLTDEEIFQNYTQKGVEVPLPFISNARKQWENIKKAELELDMSEKEFKNSARDIVNNPEGDTAGMEPAEEKHLASGLFNEEDKKKEGSEVEILDDVEEVDSVTINIKEKTINK